MLQKHIVFFISILIYLAESSSSLDSLISSQCKARCLSLIPWSLNERRVRSLHRHIMNKQLFKKRFSNNSDHRLRWNKIMEMCTKNDNCLQCTLPCEIPTSLLTNCKSLCKNQNEMCIDSCNLLNQLNESKNGQCPMIKPNTDCSSKTSQIAYLAEINNIESSVSGPQITACSQDSDCGDIQKCCSVNPMCPEQGQVCQKPLISDFNIPSIPINLTITERKKGKTVILNWQSVYDRKQPIIFVVEGKWSLGSPDSEPGMTKWGYLTHTISSNSVIIRSINRGRWYKFRVAAISKSGSFGYSKPTDLFILSSPPKAPTRPQNLTVTQVYLSQDTSTVDADISWLPPKRSDLPIENYKISWHLVENDNEEILNDQDESGEEIEPTDTNSAAFNELVSANQMNKHTIRGLVKNSKYRLEIRAIAKHESKLLTSNPFKTRLDTGKISILPVSSSLISPNVFDLDDEDFDSKNQIESSVTIQKTQSPLIYNLTVQTAFFLNGLAKAKVSWSVDNLKTSSFKNQQPLFTLTWFAIKCFGQDQSLPNPITASTLHPQFDVYELKFDCNYVVNVGLGQSRLGEAKISPQILSAQFKVPPCSEIQVSGRSKPQCYDKYVDVLSGKIDDKSISRDLSQNLVYNLLFSTHSTSVSTTRTTTSTTRGSSTNEYAFKNSFPRLPIIEDIEYKIVDRSYSSNTYSLKFSWNLRLNFNRNSFQAYQLSVNPRHAQSAFIDGDRFGAIGAIVQKDQSNFIVRDILADVDYVFQIQCIGIDSRLGPVKSIQFRVEDKQKLEHNDINRLDYEDPNELFLFRSASFKLFSSATMVVSTLTVLSEIIILRMLV